MLQSDNQAISDSLSVCNKWMKESIDQLVQEYTNSAVEKAMSEESLEPSDAKLKLE